MLPVKRKAVQQDDEPPASAGALPTTPGKLTSSQPPPKRQAIMMPQLFDKPTPLSAVTKQTLQSQNPVHLFPPGTDILQKVTTALSSDPVTGPAVAAELLQSALLVLKNSGENPDTSLWVGLSLISKKFPQLIAHPALSPTLFNLVHPHPTTPGQLATSLALPRPKRAQETTVAQLAASMLYYGFKTHKEWPKEFAEAFVLDSLGDRSWVDDDLLKPFVNELLQAMKGVPLESGANVAGGSESATQASSQQAGEHIPQRDYKQEPQAQGEDEEEVESGAVSVSHQALRYSQEVREGLHSFTAKAISDMLAKPILSPDAARSVIKLISVTSFLPKVRVIAFGHLEDWLNNPTSLKSARELLMSLVGQISDHDATEECLFVVKSMMSLKGKTLIVQNVVNESITSLIPKTGHLFHSFILKSLVEQELGNSKTSLPTASSGRLTSVQALRSIPPQSQASVLTEVFQKLALGEQDAISPAALCSSFRKLIKAANLELGLIDLCRGLMQEIPESVQERLERQPEARERWVQTIVDLICLCQAAFAPPSITELAVVKKDTVLASVLNHLFAVRQVHADAMTWCDEFVRDGLSVNSSPLEKAKFVRIVRQLLLLEPIPAYVIEQMGEIAEKRVAQQLTGDSIFFPLDEQTLRLVTQFSVEDGLIDPAIALDLISILVRKAASLLSHVPKQHLHGRESPLHITDVGFIVNIFKLSRLPPPHDEDFCRSEVLWKVFTLAIVVAAFNTETVGTYLWKSCPTARVLMEMLISKQWAFPVFPNPNPGAPDSIDSVTEEQLKLAKADSSACVKAGLNPEEVVPFHFGQSARRPPKIMIDRIRMLDHSMKLGDLLTHSLNPPFLSEMVQEQSIARAIQWLIPIVKSDPTVVDILPSSTLCELVLSTVGGTTSEQPPEEADPIVLRLRSIVMDHNPSPKIMDTAFSTFTFFFSHLSSPRLKARTQATAALKALLGSDWLSVLDTLPWLNKDAERMKLIYQAVANTLAHETRRMPFKSYLQFLAKCPGTFQITLDALVSTILHKPIVASFLLADASVRETVSEALLSGLSSCPASALTNFRSLVLALVSRGSVDVPSPAEGQLVSHILLVNPGDLLAVVPKSLVRDLARSEQAELCTAAISTLTTEELVEIVAEVGAPRISIDLALNRLALLPSKALLSLGSGTRKQLEEALTVHTQSGLTTVQLKIPQSD